MVSIRKQISSCLGQRSRENWTEIWVGNFRGRRNVPDLDCGGDFINDRIWLMLYLPTSYIELYGFKGCSFFCLNFAAIKLF